MQSGMGQGCPGKRKLVGKQTQQVAVRKGLLIPRDSVAGRQPSGGQIGSKDRQVLALSTVEVEDSLPQSDLMGIDMRNWTCIAMAEQKPEIGRIGQKCCRLARVSLGWLDHRGFLKPGGADFGRYSRRYGATKIVTAFQGSVAKRSATSIATASCSKSRLRHHPRILDSSGCDTIIHHTRHAVHADLAISWDGKRDIEGPRQTICAPIAYESQNVPPALDGNLAVKEITTRLLLAELSNPHAKPPAQIGRKSLRVT